MSHIQYTDPEAILDDLLLRYPVLEPQRDGIWTAFLLLKDCFTAGGKLLLCGNGGSAADAMHIAGELQKAFILRRRPDTLFAEALHGACPADAEYLLGKLERGLPAIPLVENAAVMTAISNDTEPKLAFAQQVYAIGQRNDALLGISTSGNSQNVVYAAEVAQALGMQVITLTGRGPNRLTPLSDCQIAVDRTEPFLVQELHLPVYHALCLMLENDLFAE